MRTFWLSSALSCVLSSPLAFTSSAAAQDTLTVEYAVKFVCGRTPGARTPLASGTYFSAINVHNPGARGVAFRWKIALTRQDTVIIGVPPTPTPGPVSGFVKADLGPDQALEIDCQHIVPRARPLLPPTPFFKGFVVLQSPSELDVVGVYTAVGSTRQIETMDIERVEPRRINRLP